MIFKAYPNEIQARKGKSPNNFVKPPEKERFVEGGRKSY